MAYAIDPVYAKLRAQAFAWSDAKAPQGAPQGVVLETGHKEGVFTLVALSDGAVSLYFSTGGGAIGAGAREGPAKAARVLARAAIHVMADMPVAPDTALPQAGESKLYVLVDGAVRGVSGPDVEFGENRRPQSPLFHAAHNLIAEIRKLPVE